MKRFTLGMLALGSLVLAGCSSDDPQQPETPTRTVAVYAPSLGDVPVPNDLLFNGTTDLTLNIPVADPNDASDPMVALSTLDGWSASAPISIDFNNPNGSIGLDSSTVVPGVSVRVFEVFADTDYFNPLVGAQPTFAPVQLVRELTPGLAQTGGEYVAVANGMSVVVVPTQPLTPRSTYLVVATNAITDTDGQPVIADAQYEIAKGENPLPEGTSLSALEPVRQLVNIYENMAASQGIAKDSIVVSFSFTVQSALEIIENNKAVNVDLPLLMGDYPVTSFSPVMVPVDPDDLDAGFEQATSPKGAALLYKGSVSLKYFMGIPDANNPVAPMTNAMTGAAMVPDGQGGFMANPLAGTGLTYVNSVAEVTGTEQVPLLVSIPASPNCSAPYSVVIFQHGLTSNRSNMRGIADSMAQICRAVIAMDMPLHGIGEIEIGTAQAEGKADEAAFLASIHAGYDEGGTRERTFGLDVLTVDPVTLAVSAGPDGLPDPSGLNVLNLSNLAVFRDNLRQATLDLLALEKALQFMDVDGDSNPEFNTDSVHYIGHSGGAIIGGNFIAYSDYIQTATLANGSGGLAKLFDASASFGPVLQGALASVGVNPGTADYEAYLFALQTMLDSSDPVVIAQYAVLNNIPTLMFQVADDPTVPNLVADAPLSGTVPWAAFMGTTVVEATEANEMVMGSRLFSRINSGGHSTFLSPYDEDDEPTLLPVTTEMQTQTATFIATNGAMVTVTDPSLLD